MKYADAVSEAKTLVKRSEADQWRLAELTYAQCRVDGVSTRKWAEDIGKSHTHVVFMKKIWEKWGGYLVTTRPSFADAYAEVKGLPVDRSERREMEARKYAEEAAAKAKAEAEAKAKAELEAEKRRAAAEATAAEARVRKEEQEKAARVKWEAEVAHRAELIRQADEAKREKLEALGRLEKQLKQEAKNQEFDVSTLNDKQRGEIMTILANDPDSADEWFDAQRQAMKRKNQEAARRAKEAMERRQFNEETQKAREAKARASKEYDDSALKTLETLKDSLEDLRRTLQAKPITMDNVLVAGYSSIDPIFELADLLYDLGDLVRDNMHQLNAESELADVQVTE